MQIVRPRNPASIARLLGAVENAEPTYAERGATLVGELPAGFRHLGAAAVLGRGSEDFARASDGLRTWQAHRLPGVRVFPLDSPLEVGASVVVALGTHCVAIAAPCRIIAVVEEPGRFGFAYGTLPGHPEQGEEAFVVTIGNDEVVRFGIRAFSRAGDSVTHLAGPLNRGLQAIATKGYLRAMRKFMDQAGHAPRG
jgi:uncharacterized protein (UPF0548 family)